MNAFIINRYRNLSSLILDFIEEEIFVKLKNYSLGF